jgi:hypothetical protein
MKRIAGLLLFSFMALSGEAQVSKQQDMAGQPVVESVGRQWARISWASAKGDFTIRYGTDPNNLNQTAKASGQRATLQNLKPGTTYYFRGDSAAEQDSNVSQFVTNTFEADKIPIYRAFSSQAGNHFYSTSYSEWQQAKSQSGYTKEGIAAYILKSGDAPNAVPLYRLYNPTTVDHFYTTNEQERQQAAAQGFRDEGIAGYVLSANAPGTVPLYRLNHSQGGDHFYTTSAEERQSAMASGYKDEGIIGYAWAN